MARGSLSWPAASLLGGLGPSARDRLLNLGALTQYPAAGRVLMHEGDTTTFVIILLDGVVKATALTQDGRHALLAVRMGGDLVGELSSVDGGPRSATVTTAGVVVARVVSQAEFLDCTRRDPQISHAVNTAVVAKLRLANRRRIDFTGCDVRTRLARVLHQTAVAYATKPGDGLPLTQPELATLAGAAEPTVHKALRDLRASGVVSTGYRSIRVLDLDRLQAIAYP
ncbi:MAG TPA: Crp/Fnr family transcriptional regulator [Actinocrinis sp.]|uniref:Crp/Fnr family transcriptional regulator n=1 Tax=Actinocrinis sp. TaxID=1920516 RepID=UPI002DDD7CEC|nr:Crp/Fnr family transcriptional regulator [Actinocrinis sp.]HEV2342782.1 Crp/Fnr family transcriptional regulator [Actinocrinis sp.]